MQVLTSSHGYNEKLRMVVVQKHHIWVFTLPQTNLYHLILSLKQRKQ